MPYNITNVGPGAWSSASLSLAVNSSVVLNVATLPVDLNVGLVNEQLVATKLPEPPLFTYDWAGFATLSSAVQYLALQGQGDAPSASADRQVYPNRKKRVYNLQVVLDVAPGGGNTRIFTLWKNGASTGLTLTFAAADTGRKRISLLVDVEDMEHLQLKSDVTGTPTASRVAWSITLSNADPLV